MSSMADSKSAQTGLKIVFMLGAALLYLLVPYFEYQIRVRGSQNFDQLADQDSATLFYMRTFRDLGWEIWRAPGHLMRDSPEAYAMYCTVVYLINAFMLFLWFPLRVFGFHKVTLVIALWLLLLVGLVVNSVGQFPPPYRFTQLEPEALSYMVGFVAQRGFGIVSPRVSWACILTHDVMLDIFPRRPHTARFLTLVYSTVVLGFLWATHQMYTASLVLSSVMAFAVYHTAEQLGRPWEHRLRRLYGKSTGRQIAADGAQTGLFTITAEEDGEEEEEDRGGGNGAALEFDGNAVALELGGADESQHFVDTTE